ncbi:MAG: hypothetical protein HY363_02365 [Candidatus Aenigmarchaeota archaeon]|nr:hypothetical protein [Candidatus Aenigmarchaeota archaeon]
MRIVERIILPVIILLVLLPATTALSSEEAINIVKLQVIETSENKDSLKAYRWQAPVLSAKEAYREPFEFDEPVWFFWIDDYPELQFAHPNRFVFVYNDEFINVLGATWYPENLSEGKLFYGGKRGIFERIMTFLRGLA